MDKNKYLRYGILIVVVVVSGICYFKYSIESKREVLSQLTKEFVPLTLDDSIEGIIIEIHQPYIDQINNNPHQAFITLEPHAKRQIMVGLELSSNHFTLDEILEVGNHLQKGRGSETITIEKIDSLGDTLTFDFAITDHLGYPIKKNKP